MQIKKSAILCAAAFAVMAAGSAQAALTGTAKTVVDDAVGAGRVVFISGASAMQKGFESIVAGTFQGTPTYFSIASADGAGFDKANYIAVAGKLVANAAAGTWNNQNAVVIYRVKGGSVYGVNPVAGNLSALGDAIESMNVNSTDCGATGAGTSASPYSCPTNTRIPDAGVSDVNPKHFINPQNTEGEVAAPQLSDTERARLVSTPLYGLAFGVPATNSVPAAAVFNRATLSAIMAGNIGTWDMVKNGGVSTEDIVVCRRVPGSGTQAVMNMWSNNLSCPGASVAPADRTASAAFIESTNYPTVKHAFTVSPGTGGLVVVENNSSADVRTCLDKAQTGGSYTTSDRSGNSVVVTFTAPGNKAVGVLSMDSLDKSKTTGNWKFRSLDGAGSMVWDNTTGAVAVSGTGKFPTLDAIVNGDWDLQGLASFNLPTRTVGAKADVLNFIKSKAQDPAVISVTSALKNVAAAIPGGAYTGASVMNGEYLSGDQCAPYSKNYNN